MTARPTAIIVIGLAALFFLSAPMTAREGTRPPGRNLTDYANPDGRPPDGIDDGTDDTPAPRQAVAAGPGVVYVGPGFYRWGKVSIPSGVAVVGAGAATVVRSSGPKQIFVQKAAQEWVIRDLVLDGEAKGDWKERRDAGQNGIFTEGCWGFEIAGVVLRNFNGAGLELTQTNLGAAGSSHGGNLERITATGNYVGVRFDIRAEY